MRFDSNQWLMIIVALIASGGPVLTAIFALVTSNKRLDDIARRLDKIEAKLDTLDDKLNRLSDRVVRLEERAGVVLTRT